ncbi:ATP-dependent DNA helicase PIF1-like protein [Tanacetum coccineum]
MELHDVSYGIEYVARPLLLFFSSENRLLWFRYQEYDLAPLKLVFEFSIYKVWKSVRYGVSKGLDTVYWGFLGVGTTFDIFQNIISIPYLEYGVLSPLDTAYWSLFLCGLCKRADIVQACINHSELWKHCKIFTLTRSMRDNEYCANGEIDTRKQDFNQWVLAVGDGKLPAKIKDREDEPTWIEIPKKYQLRILAKDKGFGHEIHKGEESEAVYDVTLPKDYAVTYSNEEMSHPALYGVKPLLLYAATFKFTRDDLSESTLQHHFMPRRLEAYIARLRRNISQGLRRKRFKAYK